MILKTRAALILVAIGAVVALTYPTPSQALGACGPNRHRDAAGYCVAGGQNENWCLRAKGHPATRMPDGTLRCL